tara:strand:- start:269 stop:823 length:555 start_codon:yes stop_codon:yes gene_type:complete
MKTIIRYFTILYILTLPFNCFAAAEPIIAEGVPYIFTAKLKSVDSTNTAVFLWESDNKMLNRFKERGLADSNHGTYSKKEILLRVAIAGAPEVPIGPELLNQVKTVLIVENYELTCFNIDRIVGKNKMPVCYIEDKKGESLIVKLHKATKKYFPLNYNLTGDSENMSEILKNVEKELIISDFML